MSQRDCLRYRRYRECDIDTKWDHCDPIECLRDMNPTNLEALVLAISIVRSYCEIHVTSLLHKTTFSPTSWRSIEKSLRAVFLIRLMVVNPGGIYLGATVPSAGARPNSVIEHTLTKRDHCGRIQKIITSRNTMGNSLRASFLMRLKMLKPGGIYF